MLIYLGKKIYSKNYYNTNSNGNNNYEVKINPRLIIVLGEGRIQKNIIKIISMRRDLIAII